MIVVMKQGSTQQQLDHVVNLVREMKLKEHVIVGEERTVVACVGNDRQKDKGRFESVPGVDSVLPILRPYKMASSEVKPTRSVIPLGKAGSIGGDEGRGDRGAVQRGESRADHRDRSQDEGRRRDRPARRGVQAADQSLQLSGPRRRGLEVHGRGARADRPRRRHGGDEHRPGRALLRLRRRAADRCAQHAELQPAEQSRRNADNGAAQARFERHARRVSACRRVRDGARQPQTSSCASGASARSKIMSATRCRSRSCPSCTV